MIGHAVKAAVVTAVKVVKVLMTPKPITPEQEEMLAKIAMSDRMLAKHWEWLKASGLVFTKRMWELTPRAELYASMITRVHGPDMDEAHELDTTFESREQRARRPHCRSSGPPRHATRCLGLPE